MAYIGTKQYEHVWENKITYHENALIYFENFGNLKTGLELPKVIENGYF